MKKLSVLGVRVDSVSLEEVKSIATAAIEKKEPALFISLGSLTVMQARKDPIYKTLIEQAKLVICDSAGVAKAVKYLQRTEIPRLSGIDLIPVFAAMSVKKGYRIFLFGAKESVVAEACRNLTVTFPGVNICGYLNGYFDIINQNDVKETIKRSAPDILLAGLGQPLQEKWLSTNLIELGVPVAVGVGGSFDVIAGRIKRAPLFFRRLGLEWLFRMIIEPWRLRRNFVLINFILSILKEKFIGGKQKYG